MGIVDEKGKVVDKPGQVDQVSPKGGRGNEGGLSLAVRTMPKLEWDEQAAEWIKLTEEQGEERRLSQVGTATLSDGRLAPPQNMESGINAAARELGLSKSEAHRAVKIASLPEPVKQAAVMSASGELRQQGSHPGRILARL
ncbi:hypothetical protein [Camelimonas lactis]|uniref:Uncharacterized protein n=1 Tax=Camelimonas lactis TaxID=659006 RepID=A0A4R2GGU3_9HYPH|nr:hypothetical protein [Camelimonas lactis]TCO07545.1 hypothetical protein EV666_1312 [Camelimonas lactis]